ncbi:hypothetical protein J40TS1_02140 [Paenibacillus montaniterrae]|uniref:Uncharacterized protein n=1 Tax=Paenibacillus montaniterrae TaxID=429341 RepID=A0A920CS92_9BACL|nr:hypothetical protein [Paenibacillus montaniterrae]GIP14572.1 hypothetical protein J40TS1_02140 [Paenibacillus montaniterrae]
MYGSWRWNLSFGIFGLIIVFLIGMINNPWTTSLLRGGYAFVLFFLLAFVVRYIMASLLAPSPERAAAEQEMVEEELAGSNIDYVTPDGEEDLNAVLREQMAQGKVEKAEPAPVQDEKAAQFQPLKPKKLVSTENMQAEDLTRAVRHLTGE